MRLQMQRCNAFTLVDIEMTYLCIYQNLTRVGNHLTNHKLSSQDLGEFTITAVASLLLEKVKS